MWFAEARLVSISPFLKDLVQHLNLQGSERIKGAYAYQTLLRYVFIARPDSFLDNFPRASPNHILPLGSDFPVEGVNPLLGFYAAVSRLSIHGTSPHGSGGW